MMASAPLTSARMVRPIAWLVEFEPAPAMTAMRLREILTAARIMASCSAGLSVEASPIVSPTTMAVASDLIWCSQSISNDAQSISSLRSNGVGGSAIKPVNHGVEYRVPVAMARYAALAIDAKLHR